MHFRGWLSITVKLHLESTPASWNYGDNHERVIAPLVLSGKRNSNKHSDMPRVGSALRADLAASDSPTAYSYPLTPCLEVGARLRRVHRIEVGSALRADLAASR